MNPFVLATLLSMSVCMEFLSDSPSYFIGYQDNLDAIESTWPLPTVTSQQDSEDLTVTEQLERLLDYLKAPLESTKTFMQSMFHACKLFAIENADVLLTGIHRNCNNPTLNLATKQWLFASLPLFNSRELQLEVFSCNNKLRSIELHEWALATLPIGSIWSGSMILHSYATLEGLPQCLQLRGYSPRKVRTILEASYPLMFRSVNPGHLSMQLQAFNLAFPNPTVGVEKLFVKNLFPALRFKAWRHEKNYDPYIRLRDIFLYLEIFPYEVRYELERFRHHALDLNVPSGLIPFVSKLHRDWSVISRRPTVSTWIVNHFVFFQSLSWQLLVLRAHPEYLEWIVETSAIFQDRSNWHEILYAILHTSSSQESGLLIRFAPMFHSIEQPDLVAQSAAFNRITGNLSEQYIYIAKKMLPVFRHLLHRIDATIDSPPIADVPFDDLLAQIVSGNPTLLRKTIISHDFFYLLKNTPLLVTFFHTHWDLISNNVEILTVIEKEVPLFADPEYQIHTMLYAKQYESLDVFEWCSDKLAVYADTKEWSKILLYYAIHPLQSPAIIRTFANVFNSQDPSHLAKQSEAVENLEADIKIDIASLFSSVLPVLRIAKLTTGEAEGVSGLASHRELGRPHSDSFTAANDSALQSSDIDLPSLRLITVSALLANGHWISCTLPPVKFIATLVVHLGLGPTVRVFGKCSVLQVFELFSQKNKDSLQSFLMQRGLPMFKIEHLLR